MVTSDRWIKSRPKKRRNVGRVHKSERRNTQIRTTYTDTPVSWADKKDPNKNWVLRRDRVT